jgi:hypothetical protein
MTLSGALIPLRPYPPPRSVGHTSHLEAPLSLFQFEHQGRQCPTVTRPSGWCARGNGNPSLISDTGGALRGSRTPFGACRDARRDLISSRPYSPITMPTLSVWVDRHRWFWLRGAWRARHVGLWPAPSFLKGGCEPLPQAGSCAQSASSRGRFQADVASHFRPAPASPFTHSRTTTLPCLPFCTGFSALTK